MNKLTVAVSVLLVITGCSQQPTAPVDEQANTDQLPNWLEETDVSSLSEYETDLPPALQSLFAEADQAFYQQQYPLALSRLERALRIAPRNASIYYRLSVIRLKQKKSEQAEQLARKALALSQQSPDFQLEVWRLIAASRAQQGDYDGERRALMRAAP